MTRVLIVCRTRLYREALAELVASRSRLSVVGLAATGDEAIACFPTVRPDVVLVDGNPRESLAISRALLAAYPEAKIISLTVPEGEEGVLQLAEAGVCGFVTHEYSLDDLVGAIRAANRGELRCSPKAAGALMRHVSTLAALQPRADRRLTIREREVVELIDAGLANKEIANSLHIQLATVKSHVHNILEKLEVHRRAEVVALLRTPAGPLH
jgi:two-component system nitrate/nitrite response regulator NarL